MHRDLKPENILLRSNSPNFELVLVDFGFAEYVNSKNYALARCGTPGYIAPEVFLVG